MDLWLSRFLFMALAGPSAMAHIIPSLNISESIADDCGFLGKGFFHHNQETRQKRFIMGGDEIDVKAVPWVVRVDQNSEHECSGTLISNRHVLTAGHCFKNGEEKRCKYAKGNYSICHLTSSNKGLCPKKHKYSIKKIHFLDDYITNNCPSDLDFVVVELTKPIKGAKPACLPTPSNGIPDEFEFTKDGHLLGYSRNFDFVGDLSLENTKLRSVNVGVPKICPKVDLLCTDYKEEAAICAGDSGGPMVEVREGRAVLIGVNIEADGNCVLDKLDKWMKYSFQYAINVHKYVYDIISVMEEGGAIDIEGSGEGSGEASGQGSGEETAESGEEAEASGKVTEEI